MRIDDFDSQWHFVPDRPEAIRRFRQTNRAMILFFAVFVLGVFVAMMVSPPVHNSVTATKFNATPLHETNPLKSHDAPLPAPQTP